MICYQSPKYCTNYKVQGHEKEECRVFQPDLRRKIAPVEKDGTKTDEQQEQSHNHSEEKEKGKAFQEGRWKRIV